MTDDRWRPWRSPPARLATAHALGLGGRARMAAGVRAVVRTDAAALELETFAADEDVTSLDVVVDGDLWRRVPLASGASTSHVDLLPGTKVVEVWLPQFGELRIGPLVLHRATGAAAVA